MKFATVDDAQRWSMHHNLRIYVEIEGVDGVLEVYPGGRKIFRQPARRRGVDYRKRLTPDSLFTHGTMLAQSSYVCHESGCGATHGSYAAHIAHKVNDHGLLKNTIHNKGENNAV